MNNKIKRKLRRFVERRSLSLETDATTVAKGLVLLTGIAFLVTQLMTNAILAPMGKELAELKKERDYLISASRSLEEDIALSTSINTTQHLSEKKLDIKPDAKKTTVYINPEYAIAVNQ